jgi:N-acetylmuramoyl-L-alanine amidase
MLMNGRRLQTPSRTGNGLFPGQQEDVLTPIMGGPKATVGQARTWLKRKAPEWAEMADLYYSIAPRYGIMVDVALTQAAKETGFFRFGGLVKPEQNNFCGLGATGPGNPGHSFPDRATGVEAHIQHLYAYATP